MEQPDFGNRKRATLIEAFDYDETRCSVNADIVAKVNRKLESRGVRSLSLDGAAFQTDDPTLVRLDPANGEWKSLPGDLQVRVVQSDPVFDHSAEETRTILFHKNTKRVGLDRASISIIHNPERVNGCSVTWTLVEATRAATAER